MKINKKDILIGLISFTILLINGLISEFNANDILTSILSGVIISMVDLTLLMSYVTLVNKPIIALMLLLASKLFSVTYDLVTNNLSSESFGLIGFTVILGLMVHVIIIIKNNKDKFNNLNFINKFKTLINFERKPIKIKIWAKIIIYSTLITVIMQVSRSEIINSIFTYNKFNIYGAIAIVLPLIQVLGILTTSNITYELFLIQIIIETFTLYILYTVDSFDILHLVFVILKVIIYLYIMTKLSNNRRKQENIGKVK